MPVVSLVDGPMELLQFSMFSMVSIIRSPTKRRVLFEVGEGGLSKQCGAKRVHALKKLGL
jgi:hypothetical protein